MYIFCAVLKGLLPPAVQPIFAFEWTDSEGGFLGQLTWTRLSHEFKNSPTFFDETLSVDLLTFRQSYPESTLMENVDSLLTASETVGV